MKIQTCRGQITLSKIEICSSPVPTRSLQYQCIYKAWWKSIDIYWIHHPEMKIRTCRGQITLSNVDEICPLAIPYQIPTISIHTPSLVKLYCYLLKLSSGNENTDRWTDEQQTDEPTNRYICGYAICGKKHSVATDFKCLLLSIIMCLGITFSLYVWITCP